jgi:hypothetical protein
VRQNSSKAVHLLLLILDFSITNIQARIIYYSIEMVIFYKWAHLQYSRTRPSIVINETDQFSVDKYSTGVLYYTTGWILQRLIFDKSEKKIIQLVFGEFADCHCLSCDDAKSANLPVELVVHRQVSKLVYSDSPFFELIKLIESIYVANLSMEMMLAYDDGSLIEHIHHAIYMNKFVREKFFLLLHDEFNDKISLSIFSFILVRFKRMRGRWFVKSLRADHGKLKGVDNLSTRTSVIAKSEIAKQKADCLSTNIHQSSGISAMYSVAQENISSHNIDNELSDNESILSSSSPVDESGIDSDSS